MGIFLFGVASWCVNLGFQIAGYQLVPVAIGLWTLGALCFAAGCVDLLRGIRVTIQQRTTRQGPMYVYSRPIDRVAKTMMALLLIGFLASATYAAQLSSSFRPAMPLTKVELVRLDDEWEKYQYTEVSGRTFRNETVLLDGFSFTNCTWEDVTFVYNGTAPTVFDCSWKKSDTFNIRTDHPSVKMTLRIIEGFQKATGKPITLDVDVRRRARWEKR
jgi:hypothetical protein